MFNRPRNSISQFFHRRPLDPNTIPLLILGIAFLAFGIKTLDQGFFHDDWHHVYYAYNYGLEGLKQFLFFDSRPFASIFYGPFFTLLGFDPFNWHLLVLLLRFFTVVAFWGCLNLIWPGHTKENILVAALFLVYPVFQVQPNSVSYALHWFTYLVFMLSLLFMVLAQQNPKSALWFSLASLLLQFFHLLMIEYFAGIELIRPLLLWQILHTLPARERLRKAFVSWLPYLGVLIVYTVLRASYSQILGYDRNTPVILLGLFSTPLDSILFLVQAVVRDLVDILLTAWNHTYDPATIDFSVYANVWTWGFAILTGFLSWIFFSLVRDRADRGEDQARWGGALLVLGLIFVALGLLPAWLSGRTFFQLYDAFDDRLALASMFGAGMVWIGGIFYVMQKQAHRYLFACLLLGLAVGLQLRTNNEYARGWYKQSQFYWQLYWRAPYIEPGTALVSEGEFLPLMGRHPTAYAINLLYPPAQSPRELNYALFTSGEHIGGWDEFRQGSGLDDTRFGSEFQGLSNHSLTIFFLPEENQCLWILRPEDGRIRNMPALTYESLPVSNISRIHRAPVSEAYPPGDIFGPEPPHTWCFYYEKAELARQYGDWLEVTRLWDQAEASSFIPGSGPEYIVFIEAFAHTGDWEKAADLTIIASKYGDNIRPALCDVWNDRLLSMPSAPEINEAYDRVSKKLECAG